MFKNRALQVRMVKSNPQDSTDATVVTNLDPEQINKIAKEQVKNVAIAVGVVVAGSKLMNTVSEIAIIAAKAKIK